jgi:hypothetical protein
MPVYLPQEILDRIIGYAIADAPRFSLCASFVSHTFHQIVLPYKFRSLAFQFNGTYTRTAYTTTIPIPNFFEAINAGDAHAISLAPLVQELTLRYWTMGGFYVKPKPLEKILNGVLSLLGSIKSPLTSTRGRSWQETSTRLVLSFRNLTKLRMEDCIFTPAMMEQLGKLVQLQSLRTLGCQDEEYDKCEDNVSFGALSNLQSLHTLECEEDWRYFGRHLACIPMKNLRILKSSDLAVIEALLTSDPPVQLKELWITRRYVEEDHSLLWDSSMLWNYLARVTSLTHLSLPDLELSDGPPPSLIFPFRELQYLHIHVTFAPRFADQPLKEMKIDTESDPGQLMVEVRQHWQGIVFPHVEDLETDRSCVEMDDIPIEIWREFLLNVNKVR